MTWGWFLRFAGTRKPAWDPPALWSVFKRKGGERRLQPELETALFRIAQEAINNVAKHAEAAHVRIHLTWEPQQVIVEVEDDGRGINLDDLYTQRDTGQGMGLLGMRERAEMFGGRLNIFAQPGQGTRIEARLPTDGGVITGRSGA